ncbi:MAG: RNA-directed DNA polymerase [Bacteroidota bacterium]
MKFYITKSDMLLAYRKAKTDAFYENGHNNVLQFIDYEKNLINNLNWLRDNILSDSFSWLTEEIVGGFSFTLKEIAFDSKKEVSKKVYFSDANRLLNNLEIDDIQFRVIGQLSVHMHVLASLWIIKVGSKLEQSLSENSYGCRLSRTNQEAGSFVTDENQPDDLAQGHFRPYFIDYKRWQNKGIKVIEDSLQKEKKIIAITLDVEKFYHRIDSSFITNEVFLKNFTNSNLKENDMHLSSILNEALKRWSNNVYKDKRVPDDLKKAGHCGIPIGFSASKVIANLLLIEFDTLIDKEIQPLYYGRYVDDIFLVLEDKNNINNSEDFWAFMERRLWLNLRIISTDSLSDENLEGKKYSILNISYSERSLIKFGPGKEKLFFLEGSSGKSYIESVKDSINENSSEWRMLPDSEKDLENFTKEMTSVSSNAQEDVNSLRKSDGISIQRLKFALHLRNFEATVATLPKEFWGKGLEKFFSLVEDFIISPTNIDTYAKYHPRLIRLALLAGELKEAEELHQKINSSWHKIEVLLRPEHKYCFKEVLAFNNALCREAIITSLNPEDYKTYDTKKLSNLLFHYNLDLNEAFKLCREAFYTDFHALPFRRAILDQKKSLLINIPDEFKFDYLFRYDNDRPSKLTFLAERLNEFWDYYYGNSNNSEGFPNALIFLNRPFTLLELSLFEKSWSASSSNLNSFKRLTQTFNISGFDAKIVSESNAIREVEIGCNKTDVNRTFALTSFLTENESWKAWVRDDNNDPDVSRYGRLYRLLNEVLRCKKDLHYIVFPELSLPRNVIIYVAKKLKNKGISLIAGIEYEKRETPNDYPPEIRGLVSNQLMYILNISSGKYQQQIAITQEKVIPAIHEERELYSTGGKWMKADEDLKYIINHGGFIFSGLICNDLLNIDNRCPLRGNIDSLIVVEWNTDIETYDGIIQATSNDLHTFVIQVNNREFGDTRLRGPYKDSYKRDRVRIRGGELDYFVVTTLEVDKLREFQRYHRSPIQGPFKPVPTGFKMSEKRRRN